MIHTLRGLFCVVVAAEIISAFPAEVRYLPSQGSPVEYRVVRRGDPALKRTQVERCFDQALFDLGLSLERLTGEKTRFVAVTGNHDVGNGAIVVGELARQNGVVPQTSGGDEDAFRIEARGSSLYLAGEGLTGDIYAIYDFLESQGFDWLLPGEENTVVPPPHALRFPQSPVERKPDFKYRSMMNSGGIPEPLAVEFLKWLVRHKGRFIGWPRKGEAWSTRGAQWHVFKERGYDKYYEAHPDIAAYTTGFDGRKQRIRYQLNTLSTNAIEMVADYIRRDYADKRLPAATRSYVTIGPADGGLFDESDESMALRHLHRDPLTGTWGMSELVFKFMNDVHSRVVKSFPNVRPMTLAYDVYADCPTLTKPDTNIFVVIADISHSRRHGACDAATSPTRAYYLKQLEDWAKSGCEIGFWNYNWNLADGVMPYTRLRIIGEDWPLYRRLGFAGMFQNECSKALCNAAAHNYLQVRMLWDVSLDWKRETESFCRKAYGAGWREMYDYLMFLVERQRNCGDETGSFFGTGCIYSRADFLKMQSLVSTAERKAAAESEKNRVRLSAYAVRQLGSYLDFREAEMDFRFADASNAVVRMMAAYEAENHRDTWSVCYGEPSYVRANLAKFAFSAAHHSQGEYAILARLPERMRFQYDPDGNGESMNYASPLIRDEEFPELSTYRSTASRQGLTAFRHGDIWYRAKVRLPAGSASEGKGVGFFLGGFDNKATLFVNGVKAGTGIGLGTPAVFDVTDFVRKDGGENSVVLRIRRDANWESMTAGILYPGFFFSGPRVAAQKDAAKDGFKLVLPGNVVE